MKRRIILIILFILATGYGYSAYLTYEPVTITQPDGMILDIFASGDEFFNWLHDKDGYTIIYNSATGYYVYATSDGEKITATNLIAGRVSPYSAGLRPWIIIPEEQYKKIRNDFFARSPKDMGDAPKTGTINNIVVYIRFADETEFTDSIAYYDRMFNNGINNTNSMYNYFKEVSYNTLFVKSTFYPIPPNVFVISYQDTNVRAYYKPFDSLSNPIGYTSSNKTFREHTLLKNAILSIASQVPDTLNIDGDNDGRVDNVCFIIYGSSTAWADLLWPHRWSLYSQTVYIHSKRVYDYNFQLQNSLKSSGVGVLCHEMFHSLGAPDLYHYTSNGINPMYRWDIMDANRNPPQHMCAHMKWKYGTWISSIPTISTPGTYTLKPLTSSTNNAYKILSPYSSIEYFVVEFRRKTTIFESSLPGDGILIIRINSTLNGNANGPPDEVYCYRPNGTLTTNGSPASANYCSEAGRTAINSGTNPSPFLLDGTQGGLNISNIGSYNDTIISFTLGTPTVIQNSTVPISYRLEQNFPNPFNPLTTIRYSVAKASPVRIEIYDILGKKAATLVNLFQSAGEYEVSWNAGGFPSGVYFYRIKSGDFTDTKTMILAK